MNRRTTVTARRDDLAVLQAEARRRGVSLARILGELVAREADNLREQNRPRFGVVRVAAAAAQASVDDEDAPYRERRAT
jgi:hypothetical protein